MSPIKTYTEEELVFLLKQRDQSAFSYLYDNYAPALNGVIQKMVEDTALAEDILQEAFVKVWNNFSAYDSSKGRLFTWLLNLTRNLTIDTLRSKGYKKQTKISADENSVNNVSDGFGADKLDTIGLRNQLSSLKPEQRILIELAYFNGYTQDEISKQTGIPLGTIKTRLRSAIFELRKMLQYSE
ncbi:RNA polymerase sigma factor [Ferruginibacter albus]|uniref:RNA polymerase sigma factor n=1 Tax=Ferruginibacter albus TaxID=2875540 RepID=UPI001CC4FF79|nr:sigma-70 family RNA polymerase sigma factor [Ferruginibacter albus]UAY51496.1 sigma-70 family RNA polymerase sigma factor [Ferruginibacter albus]